VSLLNIFSRVERISFTEKYQMLLWTIPFLEMRMSFLRISEYLAEKLLSRVLRNKDKKWLNIQVLSKLIDQVKT
jgi:hypothetical protein